MKRMIYLVLAMGAIAALVYALWRRRRAVATAEPTAASEAADFVEARARAQASLKEFHSLYVTYPANAMVKVAWRPPGGGQEQPLVAEVLELAPSYAKVRLIAPPAAGKKRVDPIQVFVSQDIVDWVIMLPDGRRRGGFTMRVEFERQRRAGRLSPEMEREAEKYVDR